MKYIISLLVLLFTFDHVLFSSTKPHKIKRYQQQSKNSRNLQQYDSTPYHHMKLSDDLITNVQEIKIKGVSNPFNASIIEDGPDNYLLAFRYDLILKKPINKQPYITKIGIVRLNSKFEQLGDFYQIDTDSNYSEDPRLIEYNGAVHLYYNDLFKKKIGSSTRGLHLAELDREQMKIKSIIPLNNPYNTKIEKNWPPFEFQNQNGSKLLFSYYINPHQIFNATDLQNNSWKSLKHEYINPSFDLNWEEQWGIIRGGTPAKLVDGEYLGFFHSSIYDKKRHRYYYYMGAYTYEAHPPFRLTRISKYPIIFKDIYSTDICKTADKRKLVIFPAGFVVKKDTDRDLIHVSCGENDSGTKIVTFDKVKLLKSLKQIAY